MRGIIEKLRAGSQPEAVGNADLVDQEFLQSLVDFVRSQIQRVQQVRLNLVTNNQRLAIDALPLTSRTRNALRQHFGERLLA